MSLQFFSIGLIALLGAMLPGPDFAIVTRNTILYSRRAGVLTAIGVGTAVLVHMSYCVLGLGLVITHSPHLFGIIKTVGAVYLIYLGICSIASSKPEKIFPNGEKVTRGQIFGRSAFWQGFLCNLLNPKATLYFLSIFTMVVRPDTPIIWEAAYGVEIAMISWIWFCSLTIILSHPWVRGALVRAEKFIAILLGVCLLGFGVALFFNICSR